MPKTTAALTATVNGEVVLYDVSTQNTMVNGDGDHEIVQRRPIKLLVLHTSSQSSVQITPKIDIQAAQKQQ